MNLPLVLAAAPEDPDIVRVLIERVTPLVPEADRVALAQVELALRTEYGGLRVRIPKRRKDLRGAQREAAYRDALSDAPLQEVLERQGISRATLYRLVKKGPKRYRGGE